ncbi:hypothetical protein [Cellulophaga sp. Asnod2-G02]|uniref:hypothetical protein n=1 Tax=Cellulophaga sp. Asnod2-G02 TaxID=3160572 RepID=UPI00386D6811
MSILNQQKKIFSLVQVELEKLGFSEFTYRPHNYLLDAKKDMGELTYILSIHLSSKGISLSYVYGDIMINSVNKILKQFIPDLSDNNELITLKNCDIDGKQEDFKKINEHLKTQKHGRLYNGYNGPYKKSRPPIFQ